MSNSVPLPLRWVRPLVALGCLLSLVACPPTDDDDSSDITPGPVGSSPEIVVLDLCEAATTEQCDTPNFPVHFRTTVVDEDDDLNNIRYFLLIEGNSPGNGRLEGDLPSGGTLVVSVCDAWVRGADIAFEFWVQDEADNLSERWIDTWTVPADGEDDCEPL